LKILKECNELGSIKLGSDKNNINSSLVRYWAKTIGFKIDSNNLLRKPYKLFTKS